VRDELLKLAAMLRAHANELDQQKLIKSAQIVQAATGLGILARKIWSR